eukprot:gene1472-12090_t
MKPSHFILFFLLSIIFSEAKDLKAQLEDCQNRNRILLEKITSLEKQSTKEIQMSGIQRSGFFYFSLNVFTGILTLFAIICPCSLMFISGNDYSYAYIFCCYCSPFYILGGIILGYLVHFGYLE